jgi:GT2 family glycosyltransferase/glycosyltransferase involved in cell wall biosynthesis
MPAFDRDSGSQDIDNTVQFLLRAGWHVTYLAREEQGVAEERHAQRLRQMGVATHAGFGSAERLLRSNEFDLAVIAFWELADKLLPLFRSESSRTRVIINSIDVHFLRSARRSFALGAPLLPEFGNEATRELNAYSSADAVIAVSENERDLLANFLGDERVFSLPIAEDVERSPYPLEQRRGMYFVGNFRHLPNREAVEYLCAKVLPLLDPDLIARHPVTILGNHLDQVSLDIDPSIPGLRLLGWVPTLQPYIEQSRIGVVPLLYGAGVKRKVIQSMMSGTPVVTTPVGAEGLELVQARHALIAADAADFAAGVTRLLTDDDLWHHIANEGATHIERVHGMDVVERRFNDIVEKVMTGNPRRSRNGAGQPERTERTAPNVADVVRRRLQTIGRPGDVMLVVPNSGFDFGTFGAHTCWPFPQTRDGAAANYEPVDAPAAINHLESQRVRGARYFVLPSTAFGWRTRYPEFFAHLERSYRRVHFDEHVEVYDIGGRPDHAARLDPTPAVAVHVRGTYAADRTGPPPQLLAELSSSAQLRVIQHWRPAGAPESEPDGAAEPAAFDIYIDDNAIVPGGFLDALIAAQVTLGVDRLQPTHTAGPAGGPPITERHFGSVAREVDEVTSLPVLSVRAGAARSGPTTLADGVTIGLREPMSPNASGNGFVRRIWLARPGVRPAEFARPEPANAPEISVLIATYERPDLLRACLASFAHQTIDPSRYELVVVDDGSTGDDLDRVIAEFSSQLQIIGVRIEHGGRSAAKNHAVLLARAPIVLFFDDDDRAAPDYLERHLEAHGAKPEEGVAILGHTDWAPELERTPLMHYVTDVDRLMFAYERLGDGQVLDWRGFWEGRISCKRALLIRHGLHDQRLGYSIDIELGWRLAPHGLRVIYDSNARSLMARAIDFDAFCERTQAKGRAHAVISSLHPGTEIAARLEVDRAGQRWNAERAREPELRALVRDVEARRPTSRDAIAELHAAYREVFGLLHTKGAAGATDETAPALQPQASLAPFDNAEPAFVYDGTPAEWQVEPLLTITIPVWSRTPELAAMAQDTINRVWEVARIPTEIVVVDNGSPFEVPLAAKVYRFPENRGVSIGWNTGIRHAGAQMIVVLNSDCRVEPGWDEALFEAASTGRRIAFPYTDHCDGLGFTQPDQGGTAGWCYMLSRATHDEIGVFDERFSPAYCEDTDYWHRAWKLGIELSPVPAAHVVHARRTSADAGADLLLLAHRKKYGWKHGVDPDRAPPYYNREIVEYTGAVQLSDRDATRPRIFGIGLNKTGTTSLHEALTMLGYDSLHWGGPAIRRIVEVALASGDPLLSRINPHFDAFSDVLPLSQNFELLDAQYPGSKFILTVRPVDVWIESRCRHVEVNASRKNAGKYNGTFLTVDEDAWRREWQHHVDRVREYFAGRDNFLEIDLTTDPAWDRLCAFLGVPQPDEPFPWVNRRDAHELEPR